MMVDRTAAAYWSPGRLLGRAAAIRKHEGFRGLWFRLLAEHVYRRLLLLERLLADPTPEHPARIPLEVEQLEADEIDELLLFHGADPRAHIEHRIDRGDVCYLARHEGRIIGCMWAARRSVLVRYLRAELQVGADEVYFYDSYVAPDRRGQGVAPALSAVLVTKYRAQGIRRAITAIIPENRANLRARAKAGFRAYARWGYVRIGPCRRDFLRPVKAR